jgi:hypothetical protein
MIMQTSLKIPSLLLACVVGAAMLVPADIAEAARGGGHGGGARAGAKSSVNRPAAGAHGGGHAANRSAGANRAGNANRSGNANANRSANVNRNQNINRNTNVNRNTNINVDRDIDIDVDHHGGWNDWDDHPFATAAAVTAGVAITSAVIGSIVYSVPPSCVTTVVNGVAYQQCGSTWYEPRYSGTTVQYVVINPPG